MTIENVILLVALLVLMGLALWAISFLYRELTNERRQHLAARLSQAHEYEMRLAQETTRLHEFYRASLQAIGNTVQYGTPTPGAASVDKEPTPEQALGREIQEDTIARGMRALRREYDAAGIRIDKAELRDEVIAIITGQPLEEPSSVRGLIDRPVVAIP